MASILYVTRLEAPLHKYNIDEFRMRELRKFKVLENTFNLKVAFISSISDIISFSIKIIQIITFTWKKEVKSSLNQVRDYFRIKKNQTNVQKEGGDEPQTQNKNWNLGPRTWEMGNGNREYPQSQEMTVKSHRPPSCSSPVVLLLSVAASLQVPRQTPASARCPVSWGLSMPIPCHPIVAVSGEAIPLCQDVLNTLTPATPTTSTTSLEGADTAHTPMIDVRGYRGLKTGKAEMEASQTCSLLFNNPVHLSPVSESDGQLVDKDPDKDEEHAPYEWEEGKCCLEGVPAVTEDSKVKDLVEASSKACEDHATVIELPGQEEESLLSPDPKDEQKAC